MDTVKKNIYMLKMNFPSLIVAAITLIIGMACATFGMSGIENLANNTDQSSQIYYMEILQSVSIVFLAFLVLHCWLEYGVNFVYRFLDK
jgi:hypothetical protein